VSESARKRKEGEAVVAENRRARSKYSFDESLEVGVVLTGSEVKAIRKHGLELGDAYAQVERGQLELLHAFVPMYSHASVYGHEPRRARRLLAHRAQIEKLDVRTHQRGFTLIPLRAYFKGGRLKIEIGVGKGKAAEDRREEIKTRESDREARAALARRRDKS